MFDIVFDIVLDIVWETAILVTFYFIQWMLFLSLLSYTNRWTFMRWKIFQNNLSAMCLYYDPVLEGHLDSFEAQQITAAIRLFTRRVDLWVVVESRVKRVTYSGICHRQVEVFVTARHPPPPTTSTVTNINFGGCYQKLMRQWPNV